MSSNPRMKKIDTTAMEPAPSMGELWIEKMSPSLLVRFEQIVEAYPQHAAIGSGSWRPTYVQLNAAANALAGEVRARCAPGGRVVLMHRLDGFLIGSLLAALKAGRVVAVFNPDDPLPRLRQNIEDVEPALIIGEPGTIELAAQLTEASVPVLLFSGSLPFPAGGSDSHTISAPGVLHYDAVEGNVDDVAFLIQTSGSTGRPKWVTRSQRSIAAGCANHNVAMRIQPDDRILLLASPSGNHTLANLFCALLYGAAICPFPVAEKGIIGLGDWLRRHDITVYVSAASAFRHFLKALRPDDRFPRIRLIRLASEAILATDLHAGMTHFNEESVYYCSYNCCEAGTLMQLPVAMREAPLYSRVPLGTPARETEILLFDEAGRPTPDGEVGEIMVKSPYLSAGYWRDAKLTAEKFKTAADGTRLYHSGDLGRREADGALYHCGRRDDVVKIRGSRVILREVEHNLRSQPGIQEAVVLARTPADGSARLVAFIVRQEPDTGNVCNIPTIRKGLAASLPDHALPAEFVFMDRIPLNANGKIDRGALLKRAESEAAASPVVHLPQEEGASTASVLSGIWVALFGAPPDARASFFEAGGDSLTAGVMAAKLHAALGVELDMLDFIRHPGFSELVRRVDDLRSRPLKRNVTEEPSARNSSRRGGFSRGRSTVDLPPIERCAEQAHYPLSFEQGAIWRHSRQSAEADRNYTSSRSYGLYGALNVEALREAITYVTNRHEILRTTFPAVDGVPVQEVHPTAPAELPYFDFSASPDARTQGIAQLRQEALRRLDLERGPLLRYALVRIAPQEHWLLRVCHQILADGWSWKIHIRELESAYRRRCEGLPLQIEPRSSQFDVEYRDYAVWQGRVLAPKTEYRQQLAEWWKQALSQQPLAHQPVQQDLPLRRSFSQRIFGAKPQPSDGRLWSDLDPGVKTRLAQLERDSSTTHFVIGLAAFAVHLAAITGRKNVVVGTHVSNRTDAVLHDMQGYLSRLMPLCFTLPATGTFLDWLQTVQQQVAAVQAHAQLPREQLWEDLRALGMRPPNISVIFGGTSVSHGDRFADLDFKAHDHRFKGLALDTQATGERAASMPWGFTLVLDANNAERTCEVTFDARLYDREKVRSFLRAYSDLLDRLSAEPDRPLASLISAGK